MQTNLRFPIVQNLMKTITESKIRYYSLANEMTLGTTSKIQMCEYICIYIHENWCHCQIDKTKYNQYTLPTQCCTFVRRTSAGIKSHIYFEISLEIIIESVFFSLIFRSKRTVSNREFIKTICDVLKHSSILRGKCVIDLIKLIEELARCSISPIELKNIFYLLREKENFDYRKQLSQSLATISVHNIPSNQNICSELLDIQRREDGITVPDIYKWTTSGGFGFIFHVWIQLDEVNEWEQDPFVDSTRYRRVVFSFLTANGTGYEIFVDNNGKLIVGIQTKKEYFATTVSSPSLIDKRWIGRILFFENRINLSVFFPDGI